MKCKECQEKLEAYYDGELPARGASSLSAHLAICADCANLLEELERESQIYRSYERELELTPALWAGINARIVAEKESSSLKSSYRTPAWPAIALGRPRIAFAAVVAFAAISFGIIAIVNKHRHELAPKHEVAREVQENGHNIERPDALRAEHRMEEPIQGAGARVSGDAETKKRRVNKRARDTSLPMLARVSEPASRRANVASNADTRNVQSSLGEQKRNGSNLTNADMTRGVVAATADAERSIAVRQSKLATNWQRHAEQTQLLLRSFRNARTRSGAVDVAYERKHARELLYRNIILRHDVARRGDLQTEELLSRIEPILLDIANLPDEPSAAEVRVVGNRIGEGELVAALHVQLTVAARVN